MYVMGVYASVSYLTYPENDAISTPPPQGAYPRTSWPGPDRVCLPIRLSTAIGPAAEGREAPIDTHDVSALRSPSKK